jgi:hypothetical protein
MTSGLTVTGLARVYCINSFVQVHLKNVAETEEAFLKFFYDGTGTFYNLL